LDPPPLVLGAIWGAGEPAFSRSCASAARECCERDPERSCAGPRNELVLEDSLSENIVASVPHLRMGGNGTAAIVGVKSTKAVLRIQLHR
jgi:hypothetical protein